MADLKPYVKATVAGLIAAIAFLAPSVDDGVSASEAMLTVSAFLVGTGVTFYVPYKSTKPAETSTGSPYSGE